MTRKMIHIGKVSQAPSEDNGQCVVRVNNNHIDGDAKDSKKFHRDHHVVIRNRKTGDQIVRLIRGAGGPPCSQDQALIDYEGRVQLGVRKDKDREDCDIIIQPARTSRVILHYWNHPDRRERFANRVAILAFGLGVLSVVVAVV